MTLRQTTSDETAARFKASYGARSRRRLTRAATARAAAGLRIHDQIHAWLERSRVRLVAARPVTSATWDALEVCMWVIQRLPDGAVEPLPSMPAMPWESNADRLRRLRVAAVERGLCYGCRLRPAKPGVRNCAECLAKVQAYKARVKGTKCINCGDPVSGTALCWSCTGRHSSYELARREARKMAGECQRCGRNPPHPGATLCLGCLDDLRDRVLTMERARGRQPKPCGTCKALGIDGTGHNRRTHDRWMARREAWK